MNDTDRIYQLFAEANPAPASSVPTTERPDADVILREQRTPTMLTREPRILEPPSTPRLRRWRGPAISLASFIVAAGFGITVWLVASNDEPDVTNPTLPQFPTTLPTTTTLPTNVVPIVVSVPDLQGLTLADARQHRHRGRAGHTDVRPNGSHSARCWAGEHRSAIRMRR
jgi:hypothetical protein